MSRSLVALMLVGLGGLMPPSGVIRAAAGPIEAAAPADAGSRDRPATAAVRESVAPDAVVALTNESRRREHLDPLKVNAKLTAAANRKLDDMIQRAYFEHRSPDGRQPWDFMWAAGYPYQYAGENLAHGYRDAAAQQQGWMHSRKHRENILNAHYTEIGVAARDGYAVVMFGRPIGDR
jgi:uncharacterized protein YkwD